MYNILIRFYPILFFMTCLLWTCRFSEASITDKAEALFEEYQKSVYKIRVIDNVSGEKYSAGSGFQFNEQGLMASNYHVISAAVHEPDRYRIRYIRQDGAPEDLSIVYLDVVHDLAILSAGDPGTSYLRLSESALAQGSRIFSLGNLHDKGIIIVEGTYNGVMEKTWQKKILFSGSLNAGMSGGPTLNHDGDVVGINVATEGNQVSYLIPVEYLQELYTQSLSYKTQLAKDQTDWNGVIEAQLLEYHDAIIDRILLEEWGHSSLGDVMLPNELTDAFTCWSSSQRKEDDLYTSTYTRCSSEDSIYVSPDLITGSIDYQYLWITSQELNPIRFYSLYTAYNDPTAYNNAHKDNVHNFECSTKFIDIDHEICKVSLCTRQYKKYPKLYDSHLNLSLVSRMDKGLIVEVRMFGFSKERTLKLVEKLLREIKWKESL